LNTTDAVLLEQAREFDAAALAEIYDRYAEPIYRYLYRLIGSAQVAEDLTGEAFVRFLYALGSRKAPRGQLRGWLYRVAHNLAMDYFRKQSKMGFVDLDEELLAGTHSPTTMLEQQQREQRVRWAIRQLTTTQQQVILLRFGEDLPISDVGKLLGKSEGSIKLLQYRAIRRLQKLLEGEDPYEKERGKSVRGVAATSGAGHES
jgi:RNA polymerase sigma-70 factor (ECF subfamily)